MKAYVLSDFNSKQILFKNWNQIQNDKQQVRMKIIDADIWLTQILIKDRHLWS